MRFHTSKRLLGLVLGWGLTLGTASAGLLPTEVTQQREGSAFRFAYNVTLTSDLELHPGDFFTIYDFAGFVPGSNAQPANFTFSSATTGPAPSKVLPSDDDDIVNLTWTYTGTGTTVGQELLGDFSAASVYGMTRDDSFAASTHRVLGGAADSNITETTVPVPYGPQVPEPTTLALFAVAVPVCGLARWVRKRRVV